MGNVHNPRRPYRAPMREDAAARTRLLITRAAKETFERQGWSGAKVAAIAHGAGVALSTVEAVFGTKPALLQAAVDYAIRGDVDPLPMKARPITAEVEAAPDAISMLELHAGHLRAVHARSAHLAFVVEQAAKSDDRVAELWRTMNANRRHGIQWATRSLLAKPRTGHLDPTGVERTFWVALDWGNYRVLTDYAGLSDDEYEQWLLDYYVRMFALKRGTRRRAASTDTTV
jgi:TetR/AcrR family transcriptional regulator, regulator of autoinduction and epiphytic fitness